MDRDCIYAATNCRGGSSVGKVLLLVAGIAAGSALLCRCCKGKSCPATDDGYLLYELSERSRARLVELFPPKFPDVRGDHITYRLHVSSNEPIPQMPKVIEVIGYACDDSLEAVVVSVEGQVRRDDGCIYHVTLSKQPHRKARESNTLLEKGWEKVEPGTYLTAFPEFRASSG